MSRAQANGIEIEYVTYGSPSDPALLMVSGFTAQLVRWPETLLQGLAASGRYVIAYDNRDIGLSTEFEGHTPPPPGELVHALQGGCPYHHLVPYVLDDMAIDAAALLDGLGVAQADVLGMSMGGMIAQLMALNHPHKVRKLIPVMTTSGAPGLPPGEPDALKTLTAVPKSRAPEDIAEIAVLSNRAIGSHESIRVSDDEARRNSIRYATRSDRPMGIARQYAAILAQPRWHERLGEVTHPTLVMHGAMDPLIRPACGKDIAARIPGARYVEIENWGHDMPPAIIPKFIAEVDAFLKA